MGRSNHLGGVAMATKGGWGGRASPQTDLGVVQSYPKA
jgi:hypothetical protein